MHWLKKWFTENLGLKLVSLALAAGLWVAFGGDTVTETVLQVPLEFRNVPANLAVFSEQQTAQLRIRGPSRVLQQARRSDFALRVDLSPVTGPGERTFPLVAENVEVPASLEVVQLVPPEVKLTFEWIVADASGETAETPR